MVYFKNPNFIDFEWKGPHGFVEFLTSINAVFELSVFFY